MNKIIKILLSIIVVLIILIIIFMCRNTFSSYISAIEGTSTTEVAEPIFVIENNEKQVLNDEKTEVDYYFDIKNFNENGERSETDLKYYIEITPIMDSSISFNLYKGGTLIDLKEQKTDYIEIKHETNVTHSYRLNVKYEREKSNSTVDINENIFIKAYAIQS